MSAGAHHGNTDYLGAWQQLFNDQRVHAYLCGHEHDLQHLREPGSFTDWIVSGGGGRELHPIAEKNHANFARAAFGFLHLSVTAQQLDARFIGTDATVLYSYRRNLA